MGGRLRLFLGVGGFVLCVISPDSLEPAHATCRARACLCDVVVSCPLVLLQGSLTK